MQMLLAKIAVYFAVLAAACVKACGFIPIGIGIALGSTLANRGIQKTSEFTRILALWSAGKKINKNFTWKDAVEASKPVSLDAISTLAENQRKLSESHMNMVGALGAIAEAIENAKSMDDVKAAVASMIAEAQTVTETAPTAELLVDVADIQKSPAGSVAAGGPNIYGPATSPA